MTLRILALSALLLFAGCTTLPHPDPSLIAYSRADPEKDARELAKVIYGMHGVMEGSSMEPFLFAGDFIVSDFTALFTSLRPGKLPVYDPNWADASIPFVCHMAVSKTGDCWIVQGINNRYSESGANAMCAADYRATVVAIFTRRAKP